jgi:iron complex transport system substrate-binding protein
MLYAIGAGDQVVAVDSYSTFPAETASKVTKMSAYEPSLEAILAYEPDVVLISNDMNKITEQLESISSRKITVWTGAAAATLDDVYKQITELGTLTGRDEDAETLIESMKARIAKATENISAPMSPKSYFYELDNTLYSLTSNTFVGALLKPFGFTNIADGVEAGNDYPQLNAEVIAKANPSIIFLADTKCCAQNAAEVSKRPGWAGIDAVKNGQIVELDDDVASRWGPRVVDLVEQFAAAIAAANK